MVRANCLVPPLIIPVHMLFTSKQVRGPVHLNPDILGKDKLDDVNHLRVTEVIEQEKRVVSVGGKEVSASQLVEQLGFTNQRQWTPVGDLSGGERRRLQLLHLLVGEPNVLMLDEPTNYLDTDTLAAVEDVLDGWPGTLVVVSYDRYLLERVTDSQLALLGDGKIRDLPGGVERYLQLRRGAASGEGLARSPLAAETGGSATTTAASGSAGPSPEEARQAKKDLNRIERQVVKTTAPMDKVHQQMSEAGPRRRRLTSGRWRTWMRSCRSSRPSRSPWRSSGWRRRRFWGSRVPIEPWSNIRSASDHPREGASLSHHLAEDHPQVRIIPPPTAPRFVVRLENEKTPPFIAGEEVGHPSFGMDPEFDRATMFLKTSRSKIVVTAKPDKAPLFRPNTRQAPRGHL